MAAINNRLPQVWFMFSRDAIAQMSASRPAHRAIEGVMILSLLKFVHAAFGLIGIYAGGVVLMRLLTGVFLEKWTVVFLKCALAVGVTALLLPFSRYPFAHQAAFVEIYVTGLAVLGYRRYRLSGIWSLMFILSLLIILCLELLVAVEHVFRYLPVIRARFPTKDEPVFLVTESAILLFFAGFGLFAIRRYYHRSTHGS